MGKQNRSFVVVGLGSFGSVVASELARFGNRVLGVDKNQRRVAALAEQLSNAVILDATDEGALREAIEDAGLPYTMNPGEGAFYGPKLEFVLRDAIGRDWQCGTWQVDFVLPERLNANYIAEDGSKQRPVMLHRAILGSFERFIGILIENYAGKLPLWLAPVQVAVATITTDANDYAEEVVEALRAQGIRAVSDLRNEKINYKVREHSHQKIPLVAVVGRREADERTIALRTLGGKDQEMMSLDDALEAIAAQARAPYA